MTQNSHRNLRLESIEAALAEIDRLVAADREGRLIRHGNWPLGQTLAHLATWVEFALDGYPQEVTPPFPIRLIARLLRNRILTKGMAPGMRLRNVPGGTLGLESVDTTEGVRRLRTALERLRTTAPTIPNPVFGPLTHKQWIQLNLRHAELHLGFLSVTAGDARMRKPPRQSRGPARATPASPVFFRTHRGRRERHPYYILKR